MTDPDRNDLDDLLRKAAQYQPDVPADLMARVLIDADHMQPKQVVPRANGFWTTMLDMIGGWPAAGSIAMAGAAGVWIGLTPPVALENVTTAVLGSSQTIELFGEDTLARFADGMDG